MPGRSIGGVAPPALNPSAGECPPVPGRRLIARATSEARHREQRQRPPRRRRLEAQVLRDAREERRLELVDDLEEAVGQRRDGHADDRGEHEELRVAAAPQQDQRIRGGLDPPSLGTPLPRVLTRIG